jgi:hypothetical protein
MKPHRFYLGKDAAEARIRAIRLEQVWAGVEKHWQKLRETARPCWDEVTLQIGMGVSRGEPVVKIEPPEWATADGNDAAALVSWLRALQDDFPMVRLTLADQDSLQEGEAYWHGEAAELLARGHKLMRKNTRQSLHQAFDAFLEAQRGGYTGHDQKLSLTGQVAVKDIKRIKEHIADIPLGDFDLATVEGMIDHWRRRPPVKTKANFGKPAAVKTVKNTIKRIRMFLKWLHRAQEWDWRLPDAYEFRPVKINVTPAELERRVNSNQVDVYSAEQLALLFKYAKPRERCWMLLALNCGFGIAELATLQKKEVHRNHKHKKFGVVGNYCKRIRTKNHVYAEWQLWDITVQAMDWYLTHYPSLSGTLFVTGKGTPLADQTSGGNRAQIIPNAWNALTNRIRGDHPNFPRLSFNKLRKTAIDGIRDVSTGEIGGVFASHGQAVASDALIEDYSNRPWNKVFTACRSWGEKLSVVFGQVAQPFERSKRKHKKSAKWNSEMKKAVALRESGKTLKAISQEMGISIGMVRHYLEEATPHVASSVGAV